MSNKGLYESSQRTCSTKERESVITAHVAKKGIPPKTTKNCFRFFIGDLTYKPVDEAEDQYNVDLVRRIAQGDQVAFALFYDRFSPVLYGMAFRMMNDRGDAEDVLQESMTYIWRKANAFDSSRRSAFAWAIMIVRNKAIDKLRARRRGERLQERVKGSSDLISDRDDTSALEPLFREQRSRVRSALSQISPDQREALELSYFSGLTHEEIAAQLGAPLGTVKARIRRGVLRLRQLFQREV
jgi:RNA polymerase sigma-70 factor, ECF subfamily